MLYIFYSREVIVYVFNTYNHQKSMKESYELEIWHEST